MTVRWSVPRQMSTVLVACMTLMMVTVGGAAPARAADPSGSDFNCSYSVPKAQISGGKLKFSVPVRCTAVGALSYYTKRQVIVDVMWDTGFLGRKEFVSWHGKALSTGATSVTFSKSGIWCNKNPRGNETMYVKARIEAYRDGPWLGIGTPPNGWNKGKDVWSEPVPVSCT